MSVPAGAQISASTTGPTGYLCSAIDADPALRSSAPRMEVTINPCRHSA